MLRSRAILFALLTSTTPVLAGSTCPYNGDYLACLDAGQTVTYCKQHVLNCEPSSGGGGSGSASCPYDDYVDCLQAGQTATYCKQYVLGCPGTDMPAPTTTCTWLVDEDISDQCPLGDGYVHVGLPEDIVVENVGCPYDSYLDCLDAGRGVTWCKQNQLNCHAGHFTTVVVPIDATCGSLAIDGTIEYTGTPEIIGNNYCLHVNGYTYTGEDSVIVDGQIDDELAQPNPACHGDTSCVCMPAACLPNL